MRRRSFHAGKIQQLYSFFEHHKKTLRFTGFFNQKSKEKHHFFGKSAGTFVKSTHTFGKSGRTFVKSLGTFVISVTSCVISAGTLVTRAGTFVKCLSKFVESVGTFVISLRTKQKMATFNRQQETNIIANKNPAKNYLVKN
jgi:hypothetical protein